MSAPEIPIEVDDETGVWSTNGLPMLFMPRHFFINNHLASEKALGKGNYAAQMFAATFRSAWDWCEYEASATGMTDIAVFHHYLKRISQRGWGQFDGGGIDSHTACGQIILHHSCFALDAQLKRTVAKTCYMFSGWFPGALEWVMNRRSLNVRFSCEEVQCAAEGHACCIFEVRPSQDQGTVE
jgi:Domain of unknown function (DUF5943)/V4R domain